MPEAPYYRVNPETGCWEWLRATNESGYGRMQHRGRSCAAHRVYYERLMGPIPVGLDLDHLCRNRGCVNPAHLEPVTRAENLRRGVGTKLNPFVVACIRWLIAAGWGYREVGRRFGIHHVHVGDIARFEKWR